MVHRGLPPLPDLNPTTGPEFLERMVTILEAAFSNEWDGPHRLVRVEHDGPDGFQLGLRELEEHPAVALEGFRAPTSWAVFGLVAFGWARHLDRPAGRQRVRTIVLVDRAGAIAATARMRDGTTIDETPVGTLPQLLRKALSL
jgi:hypothetical protein